jgi:hypothetical protein
MNTALFLKGYAFTMGGSEFPADARAIVDEAAVIRGWCVQSFAQVEFMLAYFVHRAAKTFPEYAHLGLPYRPDTRPKRVRELLSLEGPLKAHSVKIEEILTLLMSFEPFRHTIVHGWSDVVSAPNGLFLRFRRYQPTSEKPWGIEITTTRIETLREQGRQLVEFAAVSVNYFGQLFSHYGLEDGGDDDAFPPVPRGA